MSTLTAKYLLISTLIYFLSFGSLAKVAANESLETVMFRGEVTHESADKFIKDVDKYAKKHGNLIIFINSPGGDVDAYKKMVAKIRSLNVPTAMIVGKMAASAAAMLLLEADVIYVKPSSTIMFHSPYFIIDSLIFPDGINLRDDSYVTNEVLNITRTSKIVIDDVLKEKMISFQAGEDIFINGLQFVKMNDNIKLY